MLFIKKSIFLLLVSSVLLFSCQDATTSPSVDKTIVATNNTTTTAIKDIRISIASMEDWSENILASGSTVAISGTCNITFSGYSGNEYDIIAIDNNDARYRLSSVVVENVSSISFTDGDVATLIDKTITITNSTGYEVWYVYCSHVDSNSWGKDYLGGGTTIANGATADIQINGYYTSSNFDFCAEDVDEDYYSKSDIDITPISGVEFVLGDLE